MNPILHEDVQSNLVLASISPRRKKILEDLGFEFEVVPADLDESFSNGESFRSHVKRIALLKAQSVSRKMVGKRVIAADTVVVLDGEVMGKPINREDSLRMLKSLSGRKHQVATGLAVVDPVAGEFVECEVTDVYFREIEDWEMERYISTGEPMDKAGAYAIQGYASAFVERIDGCFFNVVGLPVGLLFKMLKSL